jgi:hypothetical protein
MDQYAFAVLLLSFYELGVAMGQEAGGFKFRIVHEIPNMHVIVCVPHVAVFPFVWHSTLLHFPLVSS